DRTHPAHEILVIARGRPPGHPAHLTPGARHPPAAGVGSQLAAIPAQAPIALRLASAHRFRYLPHPRRRDTTAAMAPPLARIPAGGPAGAADTPGLRRSGRSPRR